MQADLPGALLAQLPAAPPRAPHGLLQHAHVCNTTTTAVREMGTV